jgi:hypothetical protein
MWYCPSDRAPGGASPGDIPGHTLVCDTAQMARLRQARRFADAGR